MLTTHNTDQTTPLTPGANETPKRPFVEPEISGPVDVLEATAFFQPITGDVPGDLN